MSRRRQAFNVPEPMVGYAQLSRTVETPDRLWQRLVGVAARHGGYLERFVFDLEPTEATSRMRGQAQYAITRLPTWVVEIATRGASDPQKPPATVSNPVFWKLIADLFESGGVVVVPSVDHLAFLGPSEEAVLQWLSQSHPPVTFLFADSDPASDRLNPDSTEPQTRGHTR